MQNKKARLIVILIIYVAAVLSMLLYLNQKRKQEYTYSTDLGFFTVSAGEFSEPEHTLYIDENSGFSGEFAYSPGIQLRTGEYDVTVNYHATGDNTVHLSVNANYEDYTALPSTETSVATRMIVYPSADDCRIWLIYNGSGSLSIDSIVITSDIPLYTDYEYFMILTGLLGILIPVGVYYLAVRRKYAFGDWVRTGVLTVLAAIANVPAFYGYLWLGVDMRPHLMRIDGVSACIEARRIPTIIYPNYCNGYGELSCIYPDKFLYLPGLLRNRGVSLLAAYDTMHVIVNVAAIIIMYKCVKYITEKELPAFFSAVLFCFVPFRMFVMGFNSQTLGSGIAMVFFPMLFTGIYDIFFKKGQKWYLLPIGLSGMVCSHVLSAGLGFVMCAVATAFSAVVTFVMRKRVEEENECNDAKSIISRLFLSAGVFLVVCLSTMVPFVYYYRLGLNMGKMSLDFMDSLQSFYKDFLQENGIFHMVLFIVSVTMIVMLKKKGYRFKRNYDIFCLFLLISGFGLFYMSTCLFPWGIFRQIGFIYKGLCLLQFAYRFMIPGVVALCMGFGMLVKVFDDNIRVTTVVKGLAVAGTIVAVVLGYSESYGGIKDCDVLIPDRMSGSFYYRQLGYLPPGTEISYYDSPNPEIGDWDTARNITYTKVGTDIHYVYINSLEGNFIELPLFYYKGYHAYDGAGCELPIRMSETNRIIVDMETGSDEATIDVVFNVNPVFYACAAVSALGTLLLFVYILKKDVIK